VPGARIRELDIAARLGVSRTPVREAMRRLTSENLVTEAPGRGLMVASLDKRQIMELYALREVLEGMAARHAAQHAGMGDLDQMRDVHAAMGRSLADPRAQERLNDDLHLTIYEAAHNRYLMEALTNLADTLTLLGRTTYAAPGRPEEASDEHARIIDAIAARDPDTAEAAARAHMRGAARVRLRMLFDHDGGASTAAAKAASKAARSSGTPE
jgi:DNA-binding GntR family transcriptional regulator